MGTKYSTVSISNYNASPPADDGSQVASNKVQWATVKTKLTDPHNTAVAAINSNLVEMFDIGPTTKSSSYTTVAADYNTIIEASGTITITLLAAATAGAGYFVTVKNNDTNTITVSCSDGIDGSTTYLLQGRESGTFIVNAAANGYMVSEASTKTGWHYVDSYEPSADASFEIFHDGLDTGGSENLIDGWEYCLDIEGYAGNIPAAGTNSSFMIQTYEDSSWITTSGDYHYSLMTAPFATAGSVVSNRGVYSGMFVVSFGDAATDFSKTSVHITNAANSSRATNCLFSSSTDVSNSDGYNYAGNSHRWFTNWTDAATKMRFIAVDGVSTVTGRVLLFRRYVG